MAQQSDRGAPRRVLSDEDMEYIDRNPDVFKTWVSRDSVLHWFLGIAVVLGLIAHVCGYLLKTSATGEPLGLLAELLYALGLALWTGVVVTLFVQVFPDAKMRQLRRGVAEYEEWKRKRKSTRPPSP